MSTSSDILEDEAFSVKCGPLQASRCFARNRLSELPAVFRGDYKLHFECMTKNLYELRRLGKILFLR